jgi:hypothetical protein
MLAHCSVGQMEKVLVDRLAGLTADLLAHLLADTMVPWKAGSKGQQLADKKVHLLDHQ